MDIFWSDFSSDFLFIFALEFSEKYAKLLQSTSDEKNISLPIFFVENEKKIGYRLLTSRWPNQDPPWNPSQYCTEVFQGRPLLEKLQSVIRT